MTECPDCQKLFKQIQELLARIQTLESEVARLKKNSSNSSKPPSSDIVKPPKLKSSNGKSLKIGGQEGHPKHERQPFAPNEINETVHCRFDFCPNCDSDELVLLSAEPVRIFQQVEVVKNPTVVTEYWTYRFWCPRCQMEHETTIPPEIAKAGLCGPRLTSLVAYLKGACHASFSTIRKFLRDVVGLSISRGHLRKLIGKVSSALADPYQTLLDMLPKEPVLNIDESGHKENGDRLWTWCFRAACYTFFKISDSRGSDVLIDVLGKDFAGVIGSDYFPSYRKYMGDFNITLQFCLAHLIRDVKFLTTLPDKKTQRYGHRILQGMRDLFRLIHRRETMTPEKLQKSLEKTRDGIMVAAQRVPAGNEAQNMANRFKKHGQAYFTFITTPGIEPTNNLAEQAIRFIVIDRLVTQGTRGIKGREWSERIWTVVATTAQQGRSAFEFLHQAIVAWFSKAKAPSLLPDSA
jgi:transposase